MNIKLENMGSRFDLFQRAAYHGLNSLRPAEQAMVTDGPKYNSFLGMAEAIDFDIILSLFVDCYAKHGPDVLPKSRKILASLAVTDSDDV